MLPRMTVFPLRMIRSSRKLSSGSASVARTEKVILLLIRIPTPRLLLED